MTRPLTACEVVAQLDDRMSYETHLDLEAALLDGEAERAADGYVRIAVRDVREIATMLRYGAAAARGRAG